MINAKILFAQETVEFDGDVPILTTTVFENLHAQLGDAHVMSADTVFDGACLYHAILYYDGADSQDELIQFVYLDPTANYATDAIGIKGVINTEEGIEELTTLCNQIFKKVLDSKGVVLNAKILCHPDYETIQLILTWAVASNSDWVDIL